MQYLQHPAQSLISHKIVFLQTSVTYETKKLKDIEFPMYFSLTPNPGYNISGTEVVWYLFAGDAFERNGTWTWVWGEKNRSIKGLLLTVMLI